jgi:cytochrome c peroxidase
VLDLLDFLNALTDPSATDLRRWVPKRVPSGLPLAD